MMNAWKFIGAAVLAVVLAPINAFAEVKSFGDFTGGLNTRFSPILLQENESPSLQNVVLDQNGGISRRDGQSKVNSTALGGGASGVNAVYQFERSGGAKYCISFSSTTGYYSTDGCANNTVFVSTLTRNNDVNCASYGDKHYCVNNQYNSSFDGTNHVTVTQMPSDVNYIRLYRNRCFVAGKDTNPSRLYWSNLGTCDTWTTSTDYVDVDAEDGDIITGIGQDLFDRLVIYKKFSTYLLQFDNVNPSNRRLVNVSRTTGAKDQRSIANFVNRQFFLSVGPNGGQPGVYSTDGILIQEDSVKLRGSIDQLSSFFSNVGFRVIDTRADWDAGTFDPMVMSAKRDSGFMQSSATVMSATTSADWGYGTHVSLSTTDVSGSVSLSSHTFRDNACATGTVISSQWVTAASVNPWACSGAVMRPGQAGGGDMSAVSYTSTGSWQFNVNENFGSGGMDVLVYFMVADTTTKAGYAVRVNSNASNSVMNAALYRYPGATVLIQGANNTNTGNITYKVTRTQNGVFDLYDTTGLVGSATDTTYSASNAVEITANNQGVSVDSFYFFGYISSAVYKSQIFDTVISSPIGGSFSSTATFNSNERQVNFAVRQSTSPNDDMWTSFAVTSDTLRVPMNRRYQQIQAEFFTKVSTKTPSLDAFAVTAAATGTWQSSELFLSNTMNGWGNFTVDRTVTGSAAAITYSMRISTYAGGAASTGTITVTPGSVIAHSTGAYVIVGSTFSIFSATETAKDDAISIGWTEGTAAKSATMSVYKGRLHVCGQSASGTFNDVCFVRDEAGAWVKWTGVNARYLNVVGQNFYAAGSSETAGGFIYKLYDTDSDAGSAIHAYWESKDHTLGSIQNTKGIDRMYLLGSNDATVLTSTIKVDSGLRSSVFTVNLSTGAAVKIHNKTVFPAINGNTVRARFENNDASKPWSVYGYGLLYRDLGLMTP